MYFRPSETEIAGEYFEKAKECFQRALNEARPCTARRAVSPFRRTVPPHIKTRRSRFRLNCQPSQLSGCHVRASADEAGPDEARMSTCAVIYPRRYLPTPLPCATSYLEFAGVELERERVSRPCGLEPNNEIYKKALEMTDKVGRCRLTQSNPS
jgi:hypothetical protein